MAEQNRRVFKYFNGVKDVFGDPMRIYSELCLKLGDPDAAFEAWQKGNDAYADIAMADNAREAFHMPSFDPETGAGATDEDVHDAVTALLDYFEKKSLSSDTKPSSEPSTT